MYKVRIQDAIRVLEMVLAGPMPKERREETEAALADLRLALVDPVARAEMHTPAEDRPR